ncbi:MAG: hypothetical protein AABM40_04595 [Chloroflexota bacterium]
MEELILALAIERGGCRACGSPLRGVLTEVLEHYGVAHRDAIVAATALTLLTGVGIRIALSNRS